MASKKMYDVSRVINLPDTVTLSETMYSVKNYFTLPENIKKHYYVDEELVCGTTPKTCRINRDKDISSSTCLEEIKMEKLKKRQEDILQKLNQIKDKLNDFRRAPIPVPSQKVQKQAPQKQLFHLKEEIDTLKNLLVSERDETCSEKSLESRGNWLPIILEQLRCMRDEMKALIGQNEASCRFGEKKHYELKQKEVLHIINSLQTFLKTEISAFQQDTEKKTPTLSLEEYHYKVLKLVEGIQCVFEQGLRTTKRLSVEANGVITDFVISANPSNPPYSLLLIRKTLESTLRILSTSSIHSSVDKVDHSIIRHFKEEEPQQRDNYDIAFTVIWKKEPVTSLMINPLTQIEIRGEANLIRYFARLFPSFSLFRYECQSSVASEIDDWLDKIQMKLLQGSNRERLALLKSLNSKLGSFSWINGEAAGICDVFAWSAIIQLDLKKDLPPNVSAWFDRLIKEFGIDGFREATEATAGVSSDNSVKAHVDRKGLENFLKKNEIQYQSKDHLAVFTVDALISCVKDMPGLHMKNLFLKDKKDNLFLLAARHDVQVKLNEIASQIGSKDLRFANEELLFETLGVKQGCVTLFALINDHTHRVTLLLDSDVINSNHKFVNFHPLTNDATLGISSQDVLRFVKLTGHRMLPINL